MSKVRSKNSKPEMTVRRLVYALGYRYRLHDSTLPGTPDLAFRKRKKVIFVHGCFWHKHPGCSKARLPESRLEFWKEKMERNAERDRLIGSQLDRLGWKYLIVWQCQLKDLEYITREIRAFLDEL